LPHLPPPVLPRERKRRLSVATSPADAPPRCYAGLVPFSENGEMLALDAHGEVLETVDLCHDSCG
jgi:hypothetical protein